MRYNRVCPDCHEKFEAPYGSNSRALCAECREAHRKARSHRFYEEKMLGPRGPCLHCGKIIERGRAIAKYHRKCFALAQIGAQKSPETRAKMSAAQKERVLRDGLPPPHARGDKREFRHGDIQMRSPWEVALAAALDATHEPWEYEAVRLPYRLHGEMHIYITDFWLPHRNLIVEVKAMNPSDNAGKLAACRDAVLASGRAFTLVNWPPPYELPAVLARARIDQIVSRPAAPPKPWNEMTVGERLVALRRERGMAQWRLAERSGLPQGTLSVLENGKPSKKGQPPRLPKRRTTWMRLATALEMSPRALAAALGVQLPAVLSP